MEVSVETLAGLERKVTVLVPSEKIEEAVKKRLSSLKRSAKIPGFRPGKVPDHIIKARYSHDVLLEVAGDMMQPTLKDALLQEKLVPAGSPQIELGELTSGEPLKYTATFEVYPEIKVNELNNAEVEVLRSEVTSSDVEQVLNKLREQNKVWKEVTRPVADGDKVVIDFKGFLGEETFEGGAAKEHELVIGSNSMIPGFETGIIGGKEGEPFDIKVTFPADYGHKELAGKDAVFNITIHKVMEGTLPELNDDFAAKFDVSEGGVDTLKKDLETNMSRELEHRISAMNRERLFDKLLTVNEFDLPNSMIEIEIEHLKHDMYHRLFGHEHHDNEKIPDFPRVLFEAQAKRRVHLGLLFSEYVETHKLVADKERVNAMIEKFAGAYEDPDELRQYYKGNREHMAEVEALVLEEMVAEKISENVTLIKKDSSYDEIMNPKKETEKKGE